MAANASGGATVRSDPVDASGPLDIAAIDLRQEPPRLVLYLRTRGAWSPDELQRFPAADERQLCLRYRGPQTDLARLCIGGPVSHRRVLLGYERLAADGSVLAKRKVAAAIARPSESAAELRFDPADAGMRPGAIRWRLLSHWRGPECPPVARSAGRAAAASPPLPCDDRYPNGEAMASFQLRRVRPAGCTTGGAPFRYHGPRTRKLVALTFDDGPSSYTSSILHSLNRYGARSTFFEVGENVPGDSAVMRRILRSGSEIGNHSMHHSAYPSSSDLAATSARIHAVTGFRPCEFRPPYGAVNGGLIMRAWRLGMHTIYWDVDPQDWALPGSSAIYSRVVGNVRPGSIVIMHDGGGPRDETAAALPRILANLRRRGYRCVTVTRLLGHHVIWEAYG